MNNALKPTFHLHIWEGRDAINFIQVTLNQYLDLMHESEEYRTFTFEGNSTTVMVFTENMSISREQALQTATCFVRGWYISTEVDLDKLETKIERGKPAVNPPN